MQQTEIYALDFDGVICDSAVETGLTAWKAAAKLWPDMDTASSENYIDDFRAVRPIIETGYESILAMRLIYQGETVPAILSDFAEKKQALIAQADTSVDALKKLFGAVRDTWIELALDEWISVNPLFPGVAEKLTALNAQNLWYVVTTKQERFVERILSANGIDLDSERIFGLDCNMSKEAVLIRLTGRHPEQTLYFVEDRLPTLLKVSNNEALKTVKLMFATWGYNTDRDKQEARDYALALVELESFLKPL